MNMYCDRYSVCNSVLLDRASYGVLGELTPGTPDMESIARAKGWHIWKGTTEGGREQEVTLCDKCVASHRRNLAPAPDLLPNQYPIPELEIVKPPQ